MISQEIIYDEEFNLLSVDAQNIFVRMLAVSDDFGVVPANLYTLKTIINPPQKLINKLAELLTEISEQNLGILFKYNEKEWFMFKPSSFENINSYVLAKRTKSEYLKLTKEEILSEKFQELLRNSSDVGYTSIERIKKRDIRLKIKEEDSVLSEKFSVFWITYPRKTGKKPCQKTFFELNPDDELFDQIIFAVKTQKEAGMLDNGRYTPHPATWLNQERWNDQIIIKGQKDGIYAKHITDDKLRRVAEGIANDKDLK